MRSCQLFPCFSQRLGRVQQWEKDWTALAAARRTQWASDNQALNTEQPQGAEAPLDTEHPMILMIPSWGSGATEGWRAGRHSRAPEPQHQLALSGGPS